MLFGGLLAVNRLCCVSSDTEQKENKDPSCEVNKYFSDQIAHNGIENVLVMLFVVLSYCYQSVSAFASVFCPQDPFTQRSPSSLHPS